MSSRSGLTLVKNRLAGIDWQLLTFLILFVNVKLAVKAAAIILIYILRPGFKPGLSFTNSRLPLFYIIVAAIGLLNYFLLGGFFSINYTVATFTGLVFWLMCLLAMHQAKTAVEKNSAANIHTTIFVFLLINAAVSLAVYIGIIIETGAINPYRYQGNYQKYLIGTGDYIKGISFDTSTTNAVLNAFAVFYFLLRDKFAWSLFFMAIFLLTGSNITSLLLCLVLLYLFIFKSTKAQKSIIIACLALLVTFFAKVSPQNNNYVTAAYRHFTGREKEPAIKPVKESPLLEKTDSLLTADERKQKIATRYLDSMYLARQSKTSTVAAGTNPLLKEKPELPQANIHSAPYQHKDDTTSFQKELLSFTKKEELPLNVSLSLPGKAIALQELFLFFKQHPLLLITGTGMANFSSKLAFKTTGLNIAGGFPQRFTYINPYFEKNHLALYIYYFTQKAGQHSLINKPDSVYGQLLGEYGIAGVAALFVFYWWFFAKHYKQLSYGLPMLLFACGLLFLEYWFEQLSVMMVFELFLFLNIKETTA